MSTMRTPGVRHALVRRPGPELGAGVVELIERVSVDVDLARRQWESYVRCFTDHGWSITEVEPAPDCPDSVFVEDTAVVCGDTAILTRSAALSRRPELPGVRAALESVGFGPHTITMPGTVDGGDVLTVNDTLYIGVGGRTNAAGASQLEHFLAATGYQVRRVPVHKVLHLKDAVCSLPDGTVLGYPPCVDDPSVFPDFFPVPEPTGAHLVALTPTHLLVASSAPRTAAMVEAMGYTAVQVDIGELEKREGTVCCLSLRLG